MFLLLAALPEILYSEIQLLQEIISFQVLINQINSPWMGERVLARVAFVNVDTHQMLNKVLGRVADLVPIRRVKLEFTLIGNTIK